MKWLHAAFLICGLAASQAAAQPLFDSDASADQRRSLYSAADSLQRGLVLLGHPTDAFSLVDALGAAASPVPSDLSDALVAVSVEHKVAARRLGHVSPRALANADGPLILRVHPALDAEASDHYILLEEIGNGKAIVSSSRMDRQPIALADLSPLWEGDAVVLASSEEALAGQVAILTQTGTGQARWVALACGTLLFGMGLVFKPWRKTKYSFGRVFVAQPTLLMAMTAIGAGVYAATWANASVEEAQAASRADSGLLIDFRDAGSKISALEWTDIAEVDLAELIEKGGVIFVDARGQAEFDRAHLKGAISLPKFDASTIRLRLAGMSKDQTLVVYCSDKTCGRGRAASTALIRSGFTDVLHFEEGWRRLQSWEGLRE